LTSHNEDNGLIELTSSMENETSVIGYFLNNTNYNPSQYQTILLESWKRGFKTTTITEHVTNQTICSSICNLLDEFCQLYVYDFEVYMGTGSVSNSVLNFQYRGRYNTGISKMSIPVLAGIEVFSRNIPLPLKKSGKFDVKTAVKCIQHAV
jgi:hypothetical protein